MCWVVKSITCCTSLTPALKTDIPLALQAEKAVTLKATLLCATPGSEGSLCSQLLPFCLGFGKMLNKRQFSYPKWGTQGSFGAFSFVTRSWTLRLTLSFQQVNNTYCNLQCSKGVFLLLTAEQDGRKQRNILNQAAHKKKPCASDLMAAPNLNNRVQQQAIEQAESSCTKRLMHLLELAWKKCCGTTFPRHHFPGEPSIFHKTSA